MKQNQSALLVMDMQETIFSRFPGVNEVVPVIANAIAHARSNNIHVIYVAVGFRKGAPEINEYNKVFSNAKPMFTNSSSEDEIKIHSSLAPLDNEILVVKRRVSAFSGSDLDMILRANNVKHVVLTGIVTSGVVLSTLCDAADKDYGITVLSDGCADRDEEVHRVLVSKVFTRHAEVLTTREWIKK